MITISEYRAAQKTIREYNDQLRRQELGDRIVPLVKSEVPVQLYFAIVKHFAYQGINPASVTVNHISKLTKEEVCGMNRIGPLRFNQLKTLLAKNGFPKFPFRFKKI
jgi:hypothetical protein